LLFEIGNRVSISVIKAKLITHETSVINVSERNAMAMKFPPGTVNEVIREWLHIIESEVEAENT